MPFEILLVIGVIAAIAITFTKNRNQAINQAWSSVAQKRNLSLRRAAFGTAPMLTGFVEGHDLSIDIDKKRRGKHKTPHTRFRLGMSPLGLGLTLKSEGFFDGISKAFGAQDIQVGDPEFDNAVLVKGKSESIMRAYLTPERRRTVKRFLGSFSGAVITDDEISFSSKGYVKDAGELLGTIDAMLLVANSLTELRDDAASPEPEPRQPELPPERDSEPDSEAELESGDESEITEVDTPADSPAPALVAPSDSPAISEFCEALFSPGTLSFDTTRTFKQDFEGKRVVWSGTLESAAPYTVDFDFGSSGGVKAVLTIDTNDAGPTGLRNVKAVIGLPAGTEGLETRIGQRITFAGTLRKVEGFAKKVVLTDAELAN